MESRRTEIGRVGEWLLLLLLIAALTLNAVYWGAQKEGFNIDEMFSYNQISNPRVFRPYLVHDYKNNWHDAAIYEDFLTITEDEAFDLRGAWNTAKMNNAHPPLFFVVFELVTSLFFQNRFTTWSGLTTNLIFFVLHLVVFYLLTGKIFKKKFPAMAALLIYGVSLGAVNSVVFLRMYMMLTLFSTLLFYLHGIYYEKLAVGHAEPRKCVPVCFGIAFTLMLGSLTQYYYLIFAFFACLFFGVTLLLRRQWKHAVQYAGFTCGAMLVYCFVCPTLKRDLLSSERGEEALQNATGWPSRLKNLDSYLTIIDKQLFGSLAAVFLVLLALVILLLVGLRLLSRHNSSEKTEARLQHERTAFSPAAVLTLQIFLTCACTLVAVAILSPYQADRYIMNLYPALILTALAVPYALTAGLGGKGKSLWIASACVLLGLELIGYAKTGVNYLYSGTEEQLFCLESYSDRRAVLLTSKKWADAAYLPFLVRSPAVYSTDNAGVETLSDAFDGPEEFLVYIAYNGILGNESPEEREAVLKQIQAALPRAEPEMLFQINSEYPADVYCVHYENNDDTPTENAGDLAK